MLRLDKLIASTGKGTRSEVVKLIRKGLVLVDNQVVKDPSKKVDETTSEIIVDGQPVSYKEHYYIMLNKPSGYISATFDNYQKTALELISDPFVRSKLKPAGRLDIDTEGFLLLTSDGDLNHRLTGPKHHVFKTYYVELRDEIDQEIIPLFTAGIVLDDGYKTKQAFLEIKSKNSCYLSIFEGKFHQVKRMFEACDNKVKYLKRVKIGGLDLDESLAPGEYKELTAQEISLLTKGREYIGN